MIYGNSDYLPKSEYVKACKTPEGAVKLRGASYVIPHEVPESSDFRAFGIDTAEVSTLVSYDTHICDWCANVLIVALDAFSYSNTTCRHFSEFLKRYTPITYSQLKREYDHCDPIEGQLIMIDDVTVLFV